MLKARMRVVCSGCAAPHADVEGWIQLDHVRAARTPGDSDDPLLAALKRRAAWAGGIDVPPGATKNSMCALFDHGYTTEADAVVWSHEGGSMRLDWTGQDWTLGDVRPPTEMPQWRCQANPGRVQPE